MITILANRGDSDAAVEHRVRDVPALLADPAVTVWVDMSGPMDEEAMHVARDIFHFHELAIDDCFGAREHPKIEPYEGYLYLITHGLAAGSTAEETETIELDAFVGRRFLVTYHAETSRSVVAVLGVARKGDLLRRGPVSVLHAILDRQVDGIETVLDGVDERLAVLEDRVLERPGTNDMALLLALRRNVLQLRRWLTKQRDVVLRLSRGEFPLVSAQEALLFRDVHDHLVRFADLLENYRELTTSIQEAYLSVINNRLNEIMKFLTLFTALLMPLTVITGIYGMNFEHMPELKWRWGYPFALGLMAATVVGVIWFFRRRGWLGPKARSLDVQLPPPPRRTRDRISTS